MLRTYPESPNLPCHVAHRVGWAVDPGRRDKERIDDRCRSNRVRPAPRSAIAASPGNGCIDWQDTTAKARHHVCKPCNEQLGPSGIAAARQFHSLTNFAQHQWADPQFCFGDASPLRHHGRPRAVTPVRQQGDVRVDQEIQRRRVQIRVDNQDPSPRTAPRTAAP